jgi:hypothetical protein
LLARNEDVATQPWRGQYEVVQRILIDITCLKILYRLEVGGAVRDVTERALIRWNDRNGFGSEPTDDTWNNGVTGMVVDCVDSTGELIGYPEVAAIDPEVHRHYSWAFRMGAGVFHDRGGSSGPVNLVVVAVVTRHDQVEAKCAHMVEGNPGVIISAGWNRHKRGDGTATDLKHLSASCDENVALGEPGIHGLGWSDSHVSFSEVTDPRERRQNRDMPGAVDRIDILRGVFAHEQLSRRSGDACGPCDSGKGSWIGGVKDSCHRQYS